MLLALFAVWLTGHCECNCFTGGSLFICGIGKLTYITSHLVWKYHSHSQFRPDMWCDNSRFWATPMLFCWYVEENGSAAMLATKRPADVIPEVNLREHVICMLPPSANKAAHSGFEIHRRHHQMSKTGVLVALQKGLLSSNFF